MKSATGIKSATATATKDVLEHNPALDGIRGTAITLVLIFHLLWANGAAGGLVVRFISSLRGAGWIGVDLFFALSGFLITGILFDSLGDGHYLKNFYVRRVLRIFPLYYGTLAVLWLVFQRSAADRHSLALLCGYLQNLPFWWHQSKDTTLIDCTNSLWSLATEEQFYLVWPFIILLVRNRARLGWIALGLALLAPVVRVLLLAHGAPIDEAYKMTVCRADSLLGGAWLALALRGPWREKVLRLAGPAFLLACAACFFIAWRNGSFDYQITPAVDRYGFTFLAVAMTSLLAMAQRPATLVSHVMRAPALRFMGKYSYGLYVFHPLFKEMYDKYLDPGLKLQVHSKILLHLLSLAIVLGLTIPLAMLSYRFFEKPFLKLKRFFNYAHSRSATPL